MNKMCKGADIFRLTMRRLSIECSGRKATLTSDTSDLSPLPPKKVTPLPLKKEKIKIEKEQRLSQNDVKRCNKSIKNRQSLSHFFELSTPPPPPSSSSFSSAESLRRCRDNIKEVKVERGVAVVEQSRDPYGDFRRSMVEMIMARRRLCSGDLHRLLRCYLTLNPPQHHPVIVKAFSDLFMGGSFVQEINLCG